jgi:Beta-lactamase superfamily domain
MVAAAGLMLRTLGHACLALYAEGENPLLSTDPWLVGSVYWRSWWLQNYPTHEEIDWLAQSALVYITHEHPDHFHMPTIRRLGDGPTYLFPALAEPGYLVHMARQGFRAALAEPRRWRPLAGDAAMMSIPLWNDDSLLLIVTPGALILNLNDARPPPPVLRAIKNLADTIDKPRILLCSYSPASVINSFLDETGIVSLKHARNYVDYVCRLCDRLGADFYMPFASQAVFNRSDSIWANDYRTTYEHLRRYWRGHAKLLPPYTTLDLTTFTHCSTPPEEYRALECATVAQLTQARCEAEAAAAISTQDVAGLERKLNAFRWLFCVIYRRGFAFELGERCLRYDPWRGRLADAAEVSRAGEFVVAVPKLTLKEAIANGHLTDLGITMFVRIRLLRRLDPRKVYALFVLFQIDDYGHLKDFAALLRWLRRGIASTFALRLPAPPPSGDTISPGGSWSPCAPPSAKSRLQP